MNEFIQEPDYYSVIAFMSRLSEYCLSADEWNELVELDLNDDNKLLNLLIDKCRPDNIEDVNKIILSRFENELEKIISNSNYDCSSIFEEAHLPFEYEDIGDQRRFFSLLWLAVFGMKFPET